MTKKAAIFIDKWKLPIFSEKLVSAGYHYEQLPGLTEDTYLLKVQFKQFELAKLHNVIKSANAECAKKGKPK